MKHAKRSVLLWYSPREMYDLVTDIAAYPRFLPWCANAEVIAEHEDGVTARLTLAKGGLHHAFTTRNHHVAGESVEMVLVDGPFSTLDGLWRFLPIGRASDDAQGAARACRVEFDLSYTFANAALESLVSPVFDRIANTFVDAFVQRAEQVHGPR
jgi:ribosome-associated toxin RatA of RatAB toxin-antitoxin module